MPTNRALAWLALGLPVLVLANGSLNGTVGSELFPRPGSQVELDQGEEALAIKDLPTAVASAARPYFKDLAGCTASRERERGLVAYEVEGQDAKGARLTVKLADSGSILEVERPLRDRELPQAARKALEARYEGAGTSALEAVELHFFETTVTVDGKVFAVQVTANAEFLEDHHAGDQDEDQSGDDGSEEDE